MAFDKPTRNRLASFVAEARRLIAEEFTLQFQSLYGISDNGTITPLDQLGHLDDAGLATAALLRERIDYLVKTHPDDREGVKAAVARLAREQAFTILNRLAAVRMAEKRGIIAESVGKGYQSKGFKVFEQVAGSGLGDTYHRYRRYLFCLFDELAVDLGVLFDRRSPQGLLFPRETALQALFAFLNGPDLDSLWAEDETIGWIYQYYNDPAERKKMRDESAAPRNSRELAVRNQFFTPRYVVEFLTDNTLGRIWYEMTKGETRLIGQCRYLVRRPTEIFLQPDEVAPATKIKEDLSQEELLQQPVHIPHRDIKDPRELRMLDPACGSMHFGLYAFDLFEIIYEEAWDQGLKSLHRDYPEKEEFLREVPRLIIEHNIHGIDIDPRAVQIAGLSLWLRAQKSWQGQHVSATQRPAILRSNIVCAEPMPGDKQMLLDFVASQFDITVQPVFAFLLERVFNRMTLAGEAGSLLKIEEEISGAVSEAKHLWEKGPQYKQGYLFANTLPKKPEQLRLDFSGISDGSFWETTEEKIYAALRIYAEQAESSGYQRRLFAEDAARGFAFIDLCNKRYDVVVMNPPFGLSSRNVKGYMERAFNQKRLDFAACFISRFSHRVTAVGAITTRNIYYLSSYSAWRLTNILDNNVSINSFVDLGGGVLDGAMVEAALIILIDAKIRKALFFDCSVKEDKGSFLIENIQSSWTGQLHNSTFVKNPDTFKNLPTGGISYWADDSIIKLFETHKSFEILGNEAWVGLQTNDDCQWVRLFWEVPVRNLNSGRSKNICLSWVPYAKGGEYLEYFPDIHLVVQWGDDGQLIKIWKKEQVRLGLITENNSKCWNESKYFKKGVTWSQRSQKGLSTRALPEGCVFGIKGPGAFFTSVTEAEALCILNSNVFRFLVSLQMAFGSYDTGVIRRTPFIEKSSLINDLGGVAAELFRLSFYKHRDDECHRIFSMAEWSSKGGIRDYFGCIHEERTSAINSISRIKADIDYDLLRAYGINDSALVLKERDFTDDNISDGETDNEEIGLQFDIVGFASSLISKLFGIPFGRWDIRFATGEYQPPEIPDPFAPLPICSPGMLQNVDGLPAEPKDVPIDYPHRISWTGILVDDENHPEDIVIRIREALEVIWRDHADSIEHEVCELLGVKTLRDYFRRPAGFFADHLKRYSKSRRQAPIYWPLSTAKGSYTLWLYCHRITDQTLHTALADFIDPKLKAVRAEISILRESATHYNRLEELQDLENELADFYTEIERIIKLPWKPNLNDGVLITASPLAKLFRLPKWQKDLKACWAKLEKGEYDWAHLAYSIWPRRVEEDCQKDRSLAIAHNLEHLCPVEPPKPKGKRAQKKPVSEDENLNGL